MNRKILILGNVNSSHVQKWVEGIVSIGFRVGIFSLSKPISRWWEKENIELFPESWYENEKSGLPEALKLSYLGKLTVLRRAIKSFSPELLHAHYATSYGQLGRLSGFHPFIISAWGTDVFEFPKRSFLHRMILKRNLQKSDLILSTSHVMKEELKKYTNREVSVIHFGIDTQKYIPIKRKADSINIGTVKSLETIYGIEYLLESFQILNKKYPDKELRLLIAGDGTKKSHLEKLAKELGIWEKSVFTGRINQEDVPAFLGGLDVFVCPSIFESFGVSVLEASACEIPVVVSNVGGLKEVVTNKTGILVEPKKSSQISDAISYFIDNPDQRLEFGKRGRAFVIEKFNWKNNLAEINDIYNRF